MTGRLIFPRAEPLVLPALRAALPDVAVRTMWDSTLAAPFTQLVVVAEPAGQPTPVTRDVTLRMDATVRRADLTDDWQAAADVWSAAELAVLDLQDQAGTMLVHAAHQSGPLRIEAGGRLSAYGLLSLVLTGDAPQ